MDGSGISLFVYIGRFFVSITHVIYTKVRGSSNIEGKYEYSCKIYGNAQFPSSDYNAHGGQCNIKVQKGWLTTKIRVEGVREWEGNQTTNNISRTNLEEKKEWQSIRGAYIDYNRVIYMYSIPGEPVVGMTDLKIEFSGNSKRPQLRGNFYYLPNSNNPESNPSILNEVKLQKRQIEFGRACGIVTLNPIKS